MFYQEPTYFVTLQTGAVEQKQKQTVVGMVDFKTFDTIDTTWDIKNNRVKI